MAVIRYTVPAVPTHIGVMHLTLAQPDKNWTWWCSMDRPSWRPTISVRVGMFTVQQVP